MKNKNEVLINLLLNFRFVSCVCFLYSDASETSSFVAERMMYEQVPPCIEEGFKSVTRVTTGQELLQAVETLKHKVSHAQTAKQSSNKSQTQLKNHSEISHTDVEEKKAHML